MMTFSGGCVVVARDAGCTRWELRVPPGDADGVRECRGAERGSDGDRRGTRTMRGRVTRGRRDRGWRGGARRRRRRGARPSEPLAAGRCAPQAASRGLLLSRWPGPPSKTTERLTWARLRHFDPVTSRRALVHHNHGTTPGCCFEEAVTMADQADPAPGTKTSNEEPQAHLTATPRGGGWRMFAEPVEVEAYLGRDLGSRCSWTGSTRRAQRSGHAGRLVSRIHRGRPPPGDRRLALSRARRGIPAQIGRVRGRHSGRHI